MAILIIVISVISLIISLFWGGNKAKVAGAVFAVLCFPLWVILALAKKYK